MLLGGRNLFVRLTIVLTEAERVALRCLAERDCRPPREHLRFLLREEARKRGLMPTKQSETNKDKAASGS